MSSHECGLVVFSHWLAADEKTTCALKDRNTSSLSASHTLCTLSYSLHFKRTVQLTIMHPEGVPLQGMGYAGYPAQPGGPTMVHSTTVNIITEPPKDYIIWSLCCFVYSNPFCLGLAALIHSIKSRDRRGAGDLEGARYYASTARNLNIAATVLVAVAFAICIIVLIVNAVNGNRYSSHGYNY
ncbi:interferon-induced transmembrane protein 3-like [Notolabrus celidotus]|uniref:interferon-induced transmembrane protein 3-like n=1 Tax=Notolabrus celidotus TaxID=1203425 RepID=UPI001490543E|nr:interferon-induced transmembrane protein 3-like [Notolabrus celidotus]